MIDELIRVFQRHPQIIEKRTELRQELERILDVFLEL